MQKIKVQSEIGTLRRLLIHSPDGGIGKILPNKFEDWLYDDTVHLKKMQTEYDDYVKTLLYFLDPDKIENILKEEEKAKNNTSRPNCYKPDHEAYFNSDKVIEVQNILGNLLVQKWEDGTDNLERLKIIAAICAIENTTITIQERLEKLSGDNLAKVLISGILPAELSKNKKDEFLFPPVPNFVFTRDIGIIVNDHLLLSKPAKKARKRESLLTRFMARHLFFKNDKEKIIEIKEEPNYFLLDEEKQKGRVISIEGGDIMMIAPKHLLVGCSERTSPNAVNAIVNKIFARPEIGISLISVVKIPRERAQMHIDTIFTQVSRNTWVMHGKFSKLLNEKNPAVQTAYLDKLMYPDQKAGIEETEIIQFYSGKFGEQAFSPINNYMLNSNEDYKNFDYKKPIGLEDLLRQISEVEFNCPADKVQIIYSGDNQFPDDDREQWTDSCNVVAVKEGVVIGYDRNLETVKAFEKAGYQSIASGEMLEKFKLGELKPEDIKNTLILLPSGELSRARGGSHCMSMPLLRDAVSI